MSKFQAEGYAAFDELSGEIVLLEKKEDADFLNSFAIKEYSQSPQKVYSPEILMKKLGKKIRITLEEIG